MVLAGGTGVVNLYSDRMMTALNSLKAIMEEHGAAVIALEVRDVLRHRRLRDVQLLSGARVVHRSANGQKRFDTEIQHCDLYQDKQ